MKEMKIRTDTADIQKKKREREITMNKYMQQIGQPKKNGQVSIKRETFKMAEE